MTVSPDLGSLSASTALSAVTAIIFTALNTRLIAVRPGAQETTHTAGETSAWTVSPARAEDRKDRLASCIYQG
jgi:hypothetical protein